MMEQKITTEIINDAIEGGISSSPSSRLLKRPLSPDDSSEEYANPTTRTKETDPPKRTNKNSVKPKETVNVIKANKRLKRQENASTPKPQRHCQHPKHEIYLKLAKSRLSKRPLAKANEGNGDQVVTLFKRLEGVFDLSNEALMCKRCLRQTDRDPEQIREFSVSFQEIATEMRVHNGSYCDWEFDTVPPSV
ncbi:1333_t:CDS:2 [Acaulospora morrowiae]|uniref:1333_t:CDS:1 n=1 Tax=Acaulospora morrowiae TaxID=94023 RepID=A0A9N8W3C6_9GLOM|nr:1333_t:CDS:2 [Acaulospora morrowiae]